MPGARDPVIGSARGGSDAVCGARLDAIEVDDDGPVLARLTFGSLFTGQDSCGSGAPRQRVPASMPKGQRHSLDGWPGSA